jgi:shikimate kinase
MATLINFDLIHPDNKLRDQFITQASGMNLGNIIKNSKGTIYPVFHKAIGMDNVYLVFIVGSSDYILIKLAKECNFPRGFPVLWIPNIKIQNFGFYPKFSNDERQISDNLSEFNDLVELDFFKKWSGFLGQVLAFEIDGNKYWTVTSKNSAISISPFVMDAKRLVEPFMTNELLNIMIEQKLHICAEIISANDQVHGSRVLKESPIVTAIGTGHIYDLTNVDTKKYPIHGKFVDFLNNKQLVSFCVKYGLPCDSAVIIKNASVAKEFIKQLSQKRDFMTDKNLSALIQNFEKDIDVTVGTINHFDILGNCLEGLVIKLLNSDGTISIKKYKFPNYTIRTLLLRETFIEFILGHELVDSAKTFVENWCVSETGREYWFDFALQCFILYNKNSIPTDKQVGIHIQIADMVVENGIDKNIRNSFDQLLMTVTNGTIILCIGPIGSGKTTFANELALKNPLLVAIDGDQLDVGHEVTLKLGKERNDYSKWKIIEALMMGKIPVVSTGGGILFSTGKNQSFILRKQIYTTIGIMCKIIVCVPGEFTNVVQLNKTYSADKTYNNLDAVRTVITKRINTGEWKIDQKFKIGKISEEKIQENFVSFITKKSLDNLKFANKLIISADFIYGYPIITSKNYGIQKQFDFTNIITNIIPPINSVSGKFGQIRLLTLVNNNLIGHITWKFDVNKNIIFTLDDFHTLKNMYPLFIDGSLVKLISTDKRSIYTYAVPEYPIHDDGSTHITIDCGNHAAKETGNIVRSVCSGEKFISLPTNNNKMVDYNLEELVTTPCEIQILGVFGI